jgi:hypothetical protein
MLPIANTSKGKNALGNLSIILIRKGEWVGPIKSKKWVIFFKALERGIRRQIW